MEVDNYLKLYHIIWEHENKSKLTKCSKCNKNSTDQKDNNKNILCGMCGEYKE